MLSQSDIITLNKGDTIDHFLIIRKCELRTSKTNKQFLALELADKSISLNSNMFEGFEEIYTKAKSGDVVKVKGNIDDYQGSPQIKVKSIRPAKFSDDVSVMDFMAKSKRESKVMRKEFFDRVEKISNPMLSTLIKNSFTEENFKSIRWLPQENHGIIHILEDYLSILLR